MNRTSILTTARFAVSALLLAASFFLVSASFSQEVHPAAAANQPSPTELGKLELQMRSNAPDSPAFGQTTGEYWKLIAESHDFPRAYSFFAELNDASTSPNATLLASKASAAGSYISWLYQNGLQNQAGETAVTKLMKDSIAEYEQALQLDPNNFSALYGYAIFEGYRPGGQAHQKELLAKLDTLRTSEPYLPWALVDRLEKTGKPE